MQGLSFKPGEEKNLFLVKNKVLVDVTNMHLYKVHITTTTSDLKTMRTNPSQGSTEKIWPMDFTAKLGFDPMEWTWAILDGNQEMPFFNYTTQIGYKASLYSKN